MKKLQTGLGIILLLAGILFFLEGGFRLSTTRYEDLEKITSSNSGILFPSIAENTTKKDVIVSIHHDREAENTVYILEYSKNTIWDRYSLNGVHKCDMETGQFHSVVSSARYDYPYSVDLTNMSIEIYDGKVSGNLIWVILVFGVGLLDLLYALVLGRRQTEIPQ